MGDFCSDCAFDPKKNCPITNLYWAFLERHRDAFSQNHRMRLVLSSLSKRGRSRLCHDRHVFDWFVSTLDAGDCLLPEKMPEADDE
jgi:deoxyribodipyrimidine photolyase-related protein